MPNPSNPTNGSKYYTDIDYDLTLNGLSNDISVKYDINAIAQSIKNIVLTSKKEKMFNVTFGADTLSLKFEHLLPFELNNIKNKIAGEIRLQDPRVIVNNIDIKDTQLGYWQIDITFTPIYDKTLIKTISIQMQ
jgi:phage baseplate assembly protein W